MNRSILSGLAVLACVGAAQAQDLQNGKRVAENVCAECHVIDGQQYKNDGKAPGLAAVARMPSTTELALKVFLRSPHASMPAVMLSNDEMNDVVAYILGLRDRV